MKRKELAIAFILFLTLMLYSCTESREYETQSPTPEPSAGSLQPSHEPETTKAPDISIFYPKSGDSTPSQKFINDWETYISDKYDVSIDLQYVDYVEPMLAAFTGREPGMDIEYLSGISNHEGLVFVNRIEGLNQLIREDMIVPVNDIIAGLDFGSEMPGASINQFTDDGKNIWAVPLSRDVVANGRAYRRDWLLKSGFDIPETLDEFYKYAKYIAKSDPDGNGRNDTFICEYSPEKILSLLPDVFISFGCYTYAGEIISYNPHSGEYENIVMNENFQDAMGFMKLLVDEGLVYDAAIADIKVEKPKYASSMGGGIEEGVEVEYGYYLQGYNETLLIRQTPVCRGFAVLKYTQNAQDMIQKYFAMGTSDPESHMDFKCGIKDTHYFEFQNYYGYRTKKEDGGSINLIGLSMPVDKGHRDYKPGYSLQSGMEQLPREIEEEYQKSETESREAQKFTDTELVYHLDMSKENYEPAVNDVKIRSATRELFYSYLVMEMPYGTAMTNYEKKLDELE